MKSIGAILVVLFVALTAQAAGSIQATLTIEGKRVLIKGANYDNLAIQTVTSKSYNWAINALGEKVQLTAKGTTNGIPRESSLDIDFQDDTALADTLVGLIASGAPIGLTLNADVVVSGSYSLMYAEAHTFSPEGIYVWDQTTRFSYPLKKYLTALANQILDECREYNVSLQKTRMEKFNIWGAYTSLAMVRNYGDFNSCVVRHFSASQTP